MVADDTGDATPVATAPRSETVVDGTSSDEPLPVVASIAAGMDRQKVGDNEQPAASVDTKGPWVINLMSSTSQADADRMKDKAHSVGIETEQQQVMVKGTQYWRVQITGFVTEEQATAYSTTAMEKLGLKDVWILSR